MGSLENNNTTIYELRVTLDYSSPPIWRKLLVPDNFTLLQLHKIIQLAMGWGNSHLHGFHDKKTRGNCKETNALQAVFQGQLKKKIVYVYDFGDNWSHTIELQKIHPYDEKKTYPQCIGGKKACPPDDIGNLPGYYRALERHMKRKERATLKKQKLESGQAKVTKSEETKDEGGGENQDEEDEEEEEYDDEFDDWFDADFDPDHFNSKEVDLTDFENMDDMTFNDPMF